jgi:VCBS repeat-containing protein
MSISNAVIGAPTVQTVTEDSSLPTLTAVGSISISDPNPGQAAFKTSVVSKSGNLGTLSIAANGSYVYSVADSKVQYLGAGDTKTDTFTITSLDGTTKQVTFTIIGVNDAAVIGAPTVADVTEDSKSPTLKASGSISITDADQGEASFNTTVLSAAGNLGTLVLQKNGSYTYSVSNSAAQYLGAGEIKTDTFTVTALDGTTKQISFNVHGVNDAAVIGTPTVHDVTEDASNPTLTAAGSISIADADHGQAAFRTTVVSASGNLGSLVLAANGTYTYSVANSALQYLGAGQVKVDTFTVTALDGTSKQVSFTIHGANDAAVIGTPTVHDVTEDANSLILYATGSVSIVDPDQGQSAFWPTVQAGSGNVGALVMGINGAYIYAVLDSAVQYLGAGDTRVDTFTLTALDGTQKQVTFTVHGTNDAAVIGTPTVHDVTEDNAPVTLSATGKISISDVDQNQSSFQTTVVAAAGTLGALSIAANGNYTYWVANSAVQYLGAGQVKVETFTVTALDGTSKQVSFTVHGVNDAAVIGDPIVHDVTRDTGVGSDGNLTATGQLSIFDADQGQSSFQTPVAAAAGNFGHLVIAADGTYTYWVANSAAQSLGAGDVKIDSFTVTSLDGTHKTVTFTIHGSSGANQPATIGDPDHAIVVEDSSGATLTASGNIPISDPDAGEAAFQTAVVSANGNLGNLTLHSDGSYIYSVDNSAVQGLGAGDVATDSFTVTSVDGTAKVVSFHIQGVNDAAVIGDPLIRDVTEDAGVSPGGNLTAAGQLTISDADNGQAAFDVDVTPGNGNLGSLSLAADGNYTYSVANAAVQSLAGGAVHTDTFTVYAIDGTSKVISFDIHGVNDAAVIGDPLVHDVTEDTGTAGGILTATSQLTIFDADGETQFSNVVLPDSGNLGHLTIDASGVYTYTVNNADVQFLAAGETLVETFTVSSVDNTQKQLSFTIHGQQDAPVLTAADATGTDDTATPLSISATMVDDSGTLGAVRIDGIPDSYILNNGTYFDTDGHWEVPVSGLAGLQLLPVAGAANAAILNLHISVASIEGGNQAISETDMTVTLGVGANEVTARALDGYIAGATVFADANGNGVLDSGEAFAITNADGTFTLHGGSGNLVMTGGTDVLTGLAFTGTLKAPAGSTVVTPLTTLVSSLVAGGATVGDATQQVASAFNLGPVDLTTYDPVPHAVGGDAAATAVLAAGVQVQSTVVQMSAAGASSTDVFGAIASTISGTGAVDLTSTDTVSSIATSAGVAANAVDAVTAVVQAANTSIQSAPNVTMIAQAGQVAQGQAAIQLATTDFNDTTQVANLQQQYVDNLSQHVSDAVVSDPAVQPQIGTSGNDVLTGTSAGDTIDGREGADQISGGDGADILLGGSGNDRLAGNSGDDRLDGGLGFDRAVYTDATGGISVNMAAGTVSGAGVGNDTLTNIEGIVGSAYADTYNAAGFTGNANVPGSPIGFNEFEGGAGDDTIIGTVNALGAGLTRVSYVSATSGVTVDLAAGTGDGDASVGHDTFGQGIFAVWGSGYNDMLNGSNNGPGTVEVFAGFAGNDTINGRGGFDRADYNVDPATTSGINVQLAAGIVTGDASIGTDTLLSVEAVRGTNFADTYDATGFSGASANAGSNGTFNEFTGNGGNDTIIGNGNTRLNFNNATAGVTVDLAAGTADGDASVGHDTFTGVNAIQASAFNDTLLGGANNETFAGLGGDDHIDGRNGFDTVTYNNIYFATGGITVHFADGIVTGDASVGTDTLRSIEAIQGTGFADTFDATGYGSAGAQNVGNNGNYNQFEGLGGNDTITGNGNTRIVYGSATGAVNVNLATGTATGDASVGTDTITGGVNSVGGSAFGDTLTGDGNSNTLVGNGGNDSIDGGGGGDIAIFSGARGQYTITPNSPGAGQTTVADSVAGRDGTDTLTNVEVLQFTNTNVLIASGTSVNPVDLSDGRLFFNAPANPLTTMTGSANDFVKIGFGLNGHQIDLGGGANDTVILGQTGGYNLNLTNVEHLIGSTGDDFVGLLNNVTGLTIDGGGGNDNVNLANGVNSVSVTNLASLNGSDFAAGTVSNDTLTLLNNVSGLNVNLANGENTLNLATGANSFTNIYNVQHINGTAGDDTLSVSGGFGTPDDNLNVDLGAGNDTLNLGQGYVSLNVANVEQINGNALDNFINFKTNVSGIAIDLGAGNDGINLAAGANSIAVTNVENVGTGDYVGGGGSPSSDDTLTLLNNVSGVTVNLQSGDNTLNLAAGANALATYNVEHINGTSSDDALTMQNAYYGNVDLGGGNDTLTLSNDFNSIIVYNTENVIGGSNTDNIAIGNTSGSTTVTGGLGSDNISASAGQDHIRFTSAADSSVGNADTVNNFDASQDTFVFDQMSGGANGLTGAIDFIGSDAFHGSHTSEARIDINGTSALLQIDVNGDGVIDGNDIEVVLNNLTGTLSSANFSVPNQAPTDIILAGSSVAENSPNGTVVGSLSAVDPDTAGGDTATYTLIHDAGGRFAIAGSNLVVAGPLDYEAANSQQVTVRVTDSGGLTFDKSFTIGVTNVNEAPTAIGLPNASIAENSPTNTVVGTLSAVDPDTGDSATYTLLDNAGGLFAISGNLLVVAGALDYETAASHQVTVRATDAGGLTFDQTFTIATTDVNEAPTDVHLSNASVAENSPANTVVGTLSAIDPDAGDSATYTLTNNAGGLFAISGNQLVVAGALDYETAASHQVTVRATDAGGLTFDKTFTVVTTDVNEAPTGISLSNDTVTASSAMNTVVGALATIDPDAGDSATFTLLDNDGGLFAISGNNLVVAGSLSNVTAPTQNVTVRATDAGGLTYDKVFTVTVTGISGNTFPGDSGDNVLTGTPGNDTIQGFGGNDTIDGGLGFDRAVYSDATGGMTFDLASGTVTGPGVGTDTLTGIESIVGTNFDDTFDPTGFTGDSGLPGSPIGYNQFEGLGGDDTIIGIQNPMGAPITRASYVSATSGVTVNLAAGTADGDASVGHDTLIGVASVIGSAYADTLIGSNNASGTVEVFDGRAGNDTINGGGGFDRADYNNDTSVTSGITVNLAAGTVVGDASIGTDTLISVEAVRGTNFADTYDATGFGPTSINAGSNNTFNEFTGMGGDDTIIGNGATRLSYNNATAGIVFNIATGITTGDASVGTDHFSGVNAVQATMFDDTLIGGATNDTFAGLAGNDSIDGGGGFDTATYWNIYFVTGGVTVDMASGIVTGDASTGTDTLRGIEAIQGTSFADTYVATNYGAAGYTDPSLNNVGVFGTYNQFEGMGGDDTITGNGNTRLYYGSATGGVTVTFTDIGTGTADGDASVGHDVFTGVNSVQGTNFADTITGSIASETFLGGSGDDVINAGGGSDTITGGAGNDTINGGNGADMAIYTGARSQYTINFSTPAAGQTQVIDNTPNRDGTDALTSVEILQFSNLSLMAQAGSSTSPINVSGLNFGANTNTFYGTNNVNGDFLVIGQNLFNHPIDMQGGTDTVYLGATGGYTLALLNTENVVGTGGDDFLGLTNTQTGLSIDMGGGNDNVNLANGVNSVSVVNVEHLNTGDFSGAAVDDTLTLLATVSGFSVNLAQGNNTLNLAAGANSFTDVYNVQHLNGTASDDTLNVSGGFGTPDDNLNVDLGAGNDTLNLGQGYVSLYANGIEHINGNALDNFVNFKNDVSGVAIDLGDGNDNINLASGTNAIAVTNVENIGTNDYFGGLAAISDDVLTLLNNVSGVTVNLQQGDNTLNLAAGTNSFTNIFNVQHVHGTASDDVLNLTDVVSEPGNNPIVDLGGGDNTLNFNGDMSLTALNIQHINGGDADNALTLNNNVSGIAIDLGGGNDNLGLANGVNSVSISGVENVHGSDYTGGLSPSDDTLTFLDQVSGVSVDLADGNNTLNLAAGSNSLDNLYNINTLNGSASDDVLTITQMSYATTFDMGAGNDVINFNAAANGAIVANAETVNGSTGNDFITIGSSSGATTVTAGSGMDYIVAGSSPVNINFTAVTDSQTGQGDTVVNFNPAQDTFTFTGINGFTGPIHFIDNAAFDGAGSEARVDVAGSDATLQIDVNGDGLMDSHDIEVHLVNYTALHDQNFLLI